jgi:hypothetical protein
MILVEGVAKFDPLQPFIGWTGPEGFGLTNCPGCPGPNLPTWGVIGKIGAAGTPFYVGRRMLLKADAAGTLYLGVNDDAPGDNDGYFVAFIIASRQLTAVENNTASEIPQRVGLSQNFPNPFNPSTTIDYQLPTRGNIQINIYNSIGQQVKTLVDGKTEEAGNNTITWDGRNDAGSPVSSGTYFYQIRVDDQVQAKKMILLK